MTAISRPAGSQAYTNKRQIELPRTGSGNNNAVKLDIKGVEQER